MPVSKNDVNDAYNKVFTCDGYVIVNSDKSNRKELITVLEQYTKDESGAFGDSKTGDLRVYKIMQFVKKLNE